MKTFYNIYNIDLQYKKKKEKKKSFYLIHFFPVSSCLLELVVESEVLILLLLKLKIKMLQLSENLVMALLHGSRALTMWRMEKDKD